MATVIQHKVMTKQEFFERTGVEVSDNEFWALHETYCFSELDKDEFCKMWCKMNPRRVKNAKVERMIKQREQSYKNALMKWFDKYNGTQFFFDNYHTNIVYIKLSVYLVQAMSFAGISFESSTTLSDVHFKVGQYLGVYRSL